MSGAPPKKGRVFRSTAVALVRWVDTHAGDDGDRSGDPHRVDWLRVVPFAFLHAACLGVIWVGWSPVAVAVCLALYFVRMFGVAPEALNIGDFLALLGAGVSNGVVEALAFGEVA